MNRFLVAFALLVFSLLFLFSPVVSADGMLIPRDLTANIRETHQLLVADVGRDSASEKLFISIESDKNDSIIVAIPFQKKPTTFNVERKNLTDFKFENHLNEVAELAKQNDRFRTFGESAVGRTIYSYAFLTLAPAAPLGIFVLLMGGLRGGVFGSASLGSGLTPDEVRAFEGGSVEIYGVTNDNLDSIIARYGLDASLRDKYKSYGHLYLYVLTLKPVYRKKSLYGVLRDFCPDPKQALQLLGKETVSSEEWSATGCRIRFRGQYSTLEQARADCKWSGKSDLYECLQSYGPDFLSLDIVKAIFSSDVTGVQVSFDSELDDGKFWFPLGTSAFWSEPIGVTGLYLFVPQDLELNGGGLKKVGAYGGKSVFLKEFFFDNPNYDFNTIVQSKGVSAFSDAFKSLLAAILDFLHVFTYTIAFLASLLAGAAMVWFKSEKKVGWIAAFKESFKAWGLYFFGSLAAILLAAAVVFLALLFSNGLGLSGGIGLIYGALVALVAFAVWGGSLFLIQTKGVQLFFAGKRSFSEYVMFLATSWIIGLAATIAFLVFFFLLIALYYAF